MDLDRVQVVVGVLIENGRIFLSQRPAVREFPFTWECVGGKCEKDEHPVEALSREYLEEVGFTVKVMPLKLASFRFEEPEVRQACDLTFYRVTRLGPDSTYIAGKTAYAEPKLDPTASMGFGWFNAAEIQGLDLTLGNRMYLPGLLYLLKQSAANSPLRLAQSVQLYADLKERTK